MKTSLLHKEVLRLATPSIFANITIPIVGIVDTAIAGHIANATAIGGIAIGTMLFDLLYWNFGFLRVGTAGMTAQAYGKLNTPPNKDTDLGGVNSILCQSVTIALMAALLIWLLQYPFIVVTLKFIPCSPEVTEFAKSYFFIRIWAAPATLCLMAMKGWFIGMQNTIAAMVTDLVVNIVNILCSWILAIHTSLGALGVAWGTLIAQYAGLITAGILIIKLQSNNILSRISFKQTIFNALKWKKMQRLFILNTNLFIRSLCFMIIYVGFTSLASFYGDKELAVSSIMMKLFMLFSYFIDGFAYAGEALTGRFYGENNPQQLHRAIRILLFWTISIGVISTLVYAIAGTDLMRIMTNKEDLITTARPYIIWLIMMPLISCLAFMWDGIYVGATAGNELRNCMFLAAIGFVLTYFLVNTQLGIQALYLAYFVHLAIRTIYLSIRWKKYSLTN